MRDEASVELVPAPLLRRVAAFVIDWLVLFVIELGFAALLTFEASERDLVAMSLVVSASYHIVSLAVKSGTPGKTAMGLSVTDLQGQALRPDAAILRYLIWLVSFVAFIGVAISFVMIFTDRTRRRALHDRIAGTMVIVGRPRQVDRLNRYSR